MYRLLVVVLTLCLAGTVLATDTGLTPPPKADGVYPENVPVVPRQGGDTIANATVIPGLPYNNVGTTAGYNNDYDEVCPYTSSTSPDVVYAYTAGADVQVDIDLCGSLYDTKLYVYENSAGNLVACNDDFYFSDPCGVYVSFLENVPFWAGNTYYIVIDGYGGDFGDYILDIAAFEPCLLPCLPEQFLEGEPDLVDNYVDNWNGGCNSTPWVFQVVDELADDLCNHMCARSGWYNFQGSSYRDTDWFEVIAAGAQIDWTVDAEFAVNMFVLNTDCNNIQLLYQSSAGPCQPSNITFPTGAGQVFWLWVGPTVFSGPVYNFNYYMDTCGIVGEVGVDEATWGQLKDLYR